jgi:hypothetical protein
LVLPLSIVLLVEQLGLPLELVSDFNVKPFSFF